MSETDGMRALLDLEDAGGPDLTVRIPSNDLPLWPLARWPVSRALAETDIGTALPHYRRPPLLHRAQAAARRMIPNHSDARHAPRADHLFIVSGWTKATGATGFVNWLTDDFAMALGESAVVVQDAYLDRLSRGQLRPANLRTWTYARSVEATTRAARRDPLSESQRDYLRHTLSRIFDDLALPVSAHGKLRAIEDVLGRADRAAHAQRRFARLLDRVQPRRIYMQTAAYGTRAAEIALARSQGVEVVELQHGWMGSSHAAYNFGAVMNDPDLKRCLPEAILGYGEYWGRDIRFPGRFVPIGKPTLDPSTMRSIPWHDRPTRLTFVSSNFQHDVVDDILGALAAALPAEWRIALRPHPVERATAASRHAAVLEDERIELDLDPDAAAALARSRAVVGFSSTMLFEAMAYECHVAVVGSALADHYASASVFPLRIAADGSDVHAVVERVLAPPDAFEKSLRDAVWKSDAVMSFLDFARG